MLQDSFHLISSFSWYRCWTECLHSNSLFCYDSTQELLHPSHIVPLLSRLSSDHLWWKRKWKLSGKKNKNKSLLIQNYRDFQFLYLCRISSHHFSLFSLSHPFPLIPNISVRRVLVSWTPRLRALTLSIDSVLPSLQFYSWSSSHQIMNYVSKGPLSRFPFSVLFTKQGFYLNVHLEVHFNPSNLPSSSPPSFRLSCSLSNCQFHFLMNPTDKWWSRLNGQMNGNGNTKGKEVRKRIDR